MNTTYLNRRLSLIPETHTMKRTAICSRCKRQLSDPKSVEAGMGEVCRGHSGKGETMSDETTKTNFIDVFDDAIPFGKALVMRRAGQPGDADHRRNAVTNVPHLVVHHSPDGYEYGYSGSGAADLALNVCQLYLNLTQYKGRKTKCHDGFCWSLAWYLHQDFKREFAYRFNWEVASRAFESGLEGVTNPAILAIIAEGSVESTEFPEGINETDLLADAKKMKKAADQVKELRRIAMYGILDSSIYRNKMHFDTDDKKMLIKHAKNIAKIAEDFGIKLPADFTKQAETYQAEMDAAIKELG